jgi:hypothetical protein
LSWDADTAHKNLVQLAVDNSNQVKSTDWNRGRILLMDGTVIQGVHPNTYLDGLWFDQVIVADDHRLRLLHYRGNVITVLDSRCQHSIVPEDYRFQFYDLDEEVPRGI